MTMTLCLDCGARRSGIGGAHCARCGSTQLQLRRGHALYYYGPADLNAQACQHCGVSLYAGALQTIWRGADGEYGIAHREPDCETVEQMEIDTARAI